MQPASPHLPYGRASRLIPATELQRPDVEFIHMQPYGQVEAWARKPYLSFFYGITLQTRGEVTYQATMQQYHVQGGALIFTFPNNLRAWRDESADLAGCTLFVTGAYFARLAGARLLSSYPFFQWSADTVLPLTSEQVTEFEMLLGQMQAEFERGEQRCDDILRHYLAVLLLKIERLYVPAMTTTSGAGSRASQLVDAFRKLVAEQCVRCRQVTDYASQLHVSADHLSETVHHITGLSASQYIQEILVMRAKSLLRQTELSITAVADELGYQDSSYFGRFFRKKTGLTPQQFRKEPGFVR